MKTKHIIIGILALGAGYYVYKKYFQKPIGYTPRQPIRYEGEGVTHLTKYGNLPPSKSSVISQSATPLQYGTQTVDYKKTHIGEPITNI